MTRNTRKKQAETEEQVEAPVQESNLPVDTEGEKPETGETDQAEPEVVDLETAVRRSYGEAQAALRERHLAEFNEIRAAKVAAYGYTWAPKPTEREKREQALRELIAADPEAAAKILEEQGMAPSEGEG